MPLRAEQIELFCHYWDEYQNAKYFAGNTENINVFAPLTDKEQIKNDLIKLGFPAHCFEQETDWGYGKFIDLKYDIFNRYVVDGGEEPRSYYVYGFIGVGKSTLLTSIAKRLYTYLNIKPRYITMSQLARLFTASSVFENKKTQHQAQEELESLYYSKFLFIDNMSFAQLTDKQMEHSLEFFNARYSRRLPVFIASNNDIRKMDGNPFYTQLSSWMQDSNYFMSPICFDWGDRRK